VRMTLFYAFFNLFAKPQILPLISYQKYSQKRESLPG